MAATVMSAALELALVLIVTLSPSAIAPKTIASLLLVMAPSIVTVPLVFSVTPPLKVKVSLVMVPSVKFPVFWKVTALVKVQAPKGPHANKRS